MVYSFYGLCIFLFNAELYALLFTMSGNTPKERPFGEPWERLYLTRLVWRTLDHCPHLMSFEEPDDGWDDLADVLERTNLSTCSSTSSLSCANIKDNWRQCQNAEEFCNLVGSTERARQLIYSSYRLHTGCFKDFILDQAENSLYVLHAKVLLKGLFGIEMASFPVPEQDPDVAILLYTKLLEIIASPESEAMERCYDLLKEIFPDRWRQLTEVGFKDN